MAESLRIERVTIEALITNPTPVIRVQAKRLSRNEQAEIEQIFTGYEEIFKRASDVATQMVEFVDPVTRQQHTVSVAGLQMAMTQGLYAWLPERFDGSYNGNEFVLNES